MTVFTEGKHNCEFLLDSDEELSFDTVTIAANAGAIVAGTVLGKVTATGKWVPYNNVNADGSEVAAGIARDNIPASVADQRAVALVRVAEVRKADLTGLDDAGEADLKVNMVICR